MENVSTWSWFGGEYKKPENFFGRFAVDADNIFDIMQDWAIQGEELATFKKRADGMRGVGQNFQQI